jgi:hypothetical protein
VKVAFIYPLSRKKQGEFILKGVIQRKRKFLGRLSLGHTIPSQLVEIMTLLKVLTHHSI